jgi:hypothetical protein
MVLWCQISGAKRLRFDSELNRLVWWEKLVKMGSQMSRQFLDVWIPLLGVWIPQFPNSWVSGFPNSSVSGCLDSPAGCLDSGVWIPWVSGFLLGVWIPGCLDSSEFRV